MTVTSTCLRCSAPVTPDEVHACPALGNRSRFVQALVDAGHGVPSATERKRAVRSDARCTACKHTHAGRVCTETVSPFTETRECGCAVFVPPPLRQRAKHTSPASESPERVRAAATDSTAVAASNHSEAGTPPSPQPAASSAVQQTDGGATGASPSPLPSPAAKDAPVVPAATAVAGEGATDPVRSTLDDIGDELLNPVERLDRLPQTPVQHARAVSALAFVPLPPLCLPDAVRDEQDAAIVADYEVGRERLVKAITEQRKRLVKQIEAAADEALLRVHNHYGALEDAKRDLAGWLKPRLKGKKRSLDLIAYRVGFRKEGGEPKRTDDPEAQRALVRFCEDYYPRLVEYEPKLRWGDLKATLKGEGRVHEGRLVVEIENSSTGEVQDVAVPGVEWEQEKDTFYCKQPTEKGDDDGL
jgi:hypothetical protein